VLIDQRRTATGAVPASLKIRGVKCQTQARAIRFHIENLEALQAHDEIKFVISGRGDYDLLASSRAIDWPTHTALTQSCFSALARMVLLIRINSCWTSAMAE